MRQPGKSSSLPAGRKRRERERACCRPFAVERHVRVLEGGGQPDKEPLEWRTAPISRLMAAGTARGVTLFSLACRAVVCYCLLAAAASAFGASLFGIMPGQNIEAAQAVFEARNGERVAVGEVEEGTVSLGELRWNGMHFVLDGGAGAVVADGMDRIQCMAFAGAFLEKMSGYPFMDTASEFAWLLDRLGVEDADRGGDWTQSDVLLPLAHDYWSDGKSKPAFHLKVFPDKTAVLQVVRPDAGR